MPISDAVRRLEKKWKGGQGWPQRLEWLEINGLRGWTGQRIHFSFPIISIVGENGSGKSTILQSAASVYRADDRRNTFFPSEFFPDTAWDKVEGVIIKYGYQQGTNHKEGSVRKPTTRWLGHDERPERRIEYIDLSRIQPVGARVGYAKIAKSKHIEDSSIPFDLEQTKRFSFVMGKDYDSAKMAFADVDTKREIPVISKSQVSYSGFHQGSGETTVAELLRTELPKYSLVLIDEIESSLHPRAQRRLIHDLAEKCRQQDVQIILTTHSPYILDELPPEARLCILEKGGKRETFSGVSPQFAMTKMDDEAYPECDLYVEDEAAGTLLEEIIAKHGQEVFGRCSIVPYGASNVGHALGQMVSSNFFKRPTCVYLDGDNEVSPGCILLPGGDAPERVVFGNLRTRNYGDVWSRLQRDSTSVLDECNKAMTLNDHHEWVKAAAKNLSCSPDTLWQSLCAEWVGSLSQEEAARIINPIRNILP